MNSRLKPVAYMLARLATEGRFIAIWLTLTCGQPI